jgi:hypothetical protein
VKGKKGVEEEMKIDISGKIADLKFKCLID